MEALKERKDRIGAEAVALRCELSEVEKERRQVIADDPASDEDEAAAAGEVKWEDFEAFLATANIPANLAQSVEALSRLRTLALSRSTQQSVAAKPVKRRWEAQDVQQLASTMFGNTGQPPALEHVQRSVDVLNDIDNNKRRVLPVKRSPRADGGNYECHCLEGLQLGPARLRAPAGPRL